VTSPAGPLTSCGARSMVMRNRHDGSGSPGGWDDLPPRVRDRMRRWPPDGSSTESRQLTSAPPRARPSGPNPVREFARFALLFLAVAVANVLFLLLALFYLHPRSP